MTEEMSTLYDPKAIEPKATSLWNELNAFHADPNVSGNTKGAFTIVIPPPNVTAALHLGHALNNTLQDIMIRMRRMQGFATLWMPGTDHAGIATQTVVEKRILSEEGKRRTDFVREEFVGRVQAWKDEYEQRIIEQLQSMGCSCDWQRTRFTMDDVCAKAVRATFFKLFQDGLIYRGKRLVNWDPATQTVLADDEVEHETIQGHFWYLQYPLIDPVEVDGKKIDHVTVATTRPETMLGDTAVAMNPSDPRAATLVGKQIRLPIVGRLIPIIADEHVVLPNPENDDEKAKFSTGFLKVTPAHDPDDWAIGQRHDLPIINVMGPDGAISDKFGWEDANEAEAQQLIGMDRFEAREAIVEWFRQENLLEEVREYSHEVGHSYRSHVPIEPYLSDQWYIAVKKQIEHLAEKIGSGTIGGTDVPVNSLAGLALKPLLDGRLRFIPDRYAKTYQTWLENLRDWPISRQLWWGHQIPVWSRTIDLEKSDWQNDLRNKLGLDHLFSGEISQDDISWCVINNETHKIIKDPNTEWSKIKGIYTVYLCLHNDSSIDRLEKAGFKRDDDVLDTWFSSALWPFSTMGWPDETAELKTFYPGNVLCTAREIITLWVSRMVMMGQYCAGDIPFTEVFIHAMIQDGQGRKMSKSLGNGIDPLVAIDSHGADAMRFALASMTTQTQDVRMPVELMKLPDGREVNTSPKFDLGRNFCNKLWNASRFAMTNLEPLPDKPVDREQLRLEDRWILSRLTQTTTAVTQYMEEFKFSEPINALYRFFWNELCDWYLEMIKPRMRQENEKATAQRVLAYVLDTTLRLFHPFLPFITEGIYQQLNAVCPSRELKGVAELPGAKALVIASWPEPNMGLIDTTAEQQMQLIQDVIRLVRDLRTQYKVPPRQPLEVSVKASVELSERLNGQQGLLCQMTNIEHFQADPSSEKPEHAAMAIFEDLEVYVHHVIDPEAELKRLQKQKEELLGHIRTTQAKLSNENFVSRAKPEVVQRERDRLVQLSEQLAAIEKNL